MKKRRLICLLSALIMGTSLVACGGAAGDKAEGSGENKVLKIAAFEGGYGKEYWETLKEKFEAANEGVTVELKVKSNLE